MHQTEQQQMFNLLLPIRRQRLQRTERQLKYYQQQINEMEKDKQQQQQRVQQQQQRYQQLQAELACQHQAAEQLNVELERAARHWQCLQQKWQQLQQTVEQLTGTRQSEQQYLELRRKQQKAIEKLEYLQQQPGGF